MKRRSLKCNDVRYNSFTFPKGGKGDRLRWMRMSKKLYYQAFIKRTESLKLMTQSLYYLSQEHINEIRNIRSDHDSAL